jgi:hypothetical protein
METRNSLLMLKTSIIFVLITLGTSYAGNSQVHNNYGFEYTYDNDGNRTRRMYIELLPSKTTPSEEDAIDTASIIDNFSNLEFIIHPNPTAGIVQVDIPGSKDIDIKFSLFTLQGTLINSMPQVGSSVIIELSKHPAGVYILVCQINNQRKEWKIIKE